MVTVILGTLLAAVLATGAVWGADRFAQRRELRLGAWTQVLFQRKAWDVDTRWGPVRVFGGCERCYTSWRYVTPVLIGIRPYERLTVISPFCTGCHGEMRGRVLEEAYLDWWLAHRDAVIAEGVNEPPDRREWDAIKDQLLVGRRPESIVA